MAKRRKSARAKTKSKKRGAATGKKTVKRAVAKRAKKTAKKVAAKGTRKRETKRTRVVPVMEDTVVDVVDEPVPGVVRVTEIEEVNVAVSDSEEEKDED